MTVLPLLATGLVMTLVGILFVVCSVSLILIVLVQKGRGGGLSGAFGGAMASGILGSKTGDFLTWVTIVLAGVFLLLAIVLAKFLRSDVEDFGVDQTTAQTTSSTQGQSIPSASTEAPSRGVDMAGQAGQPVNNIPVTSGGDNQTSAGDTDNRSDANEIQLPGG